MWDEIFQKEIEDFWSYRDCFLTSYLNDLWDSLCLKYVVVVWEIRVYILWVTRWVKCGSMTRPLDQSIFISKSFSIRANRCCSAAKSCLVLHDPMDYSRPGSFILLCLMELFKFMCIESEMLSNHLILCCSLLLLPSIFPRISLFQWVCSLHQMAKVLDLQLQHPSFQWIVRVDFFLDWLVCFSCYQGTLKSHQHHTSKALMLWCSVFFMIKLSHLYMTNRKTIALTI